MKLYKALKRIKKECIKQYSCEDCKFFSKNENKCFIDTSPNCWNIKQLKKESE